MLGILPLEQPGGRGPRRRSRNFDDLLDRPLVVWATDGLPIGPAAFPSGRSLDSRTRPQRWPEPLGFSDGWREGELRFVKVALYLDHLTRDSGCLRVIPGSHRFADAFAEALQGQVRESEDLWGIEGAAVPA